MQSPQPKTLSDGQTSLILPRGCLYDPYEHAHALGLNVLIRPIKADEYLMERKYRTIVVRSDLRDAHRRTALAHGIAHWELMHPDDRPKYELQADRYAALYLIHPRELAEVSAWTDDPGKIATELGVTRRLLEAYRSKE